MCEFLTILAPLHDMPCIHDLYTRTVLVRINHMQLIIYVRATLDPRLLADEFQASSIYAAKSHGMPLEAINV